MKPLNEVQRQILDYLRQTIGSGIPPTVREIGQAFVHELFVVWKKDHPDFIMNIENASDDVLGMIRRVENTK